MIFTETELHGVFLVTPEPQDDERGSFARTYCHMEFVRHGLNPRVLQCNLSYNRRKGTLRGLHFQVEPHGEAKLVTCINGAIYDVVVDLRRESPTYGRWSALELQARHPRSMLYIPENFAHGFQTLVDDSEVFYQMSEFYHPESARGIRWDDPGFKINWPEGAKIISAKDQSYPDFSR